LIAVIRLANRDSEFGSSWCTDSLKIRSLVAGGCNDSDAVLGEIVDFTADWIRAIRGKVRGDRQVQDLDAELPEALARVNDLVHIPVYAEAILRNHDVCSWSDTRDQPNDASLMTDQVANIGTQEAESVDCTIRKVRMC
jgi:hypothetical protein